MTKIPHKQARGFSLMEMLVSCAILAIVLFAVASMMNMTSRTYRHTSGKIDAFETANVAFDTLTQTLRQATLVSYFGYNDKSDPTQYVFRSNLHFYLNPSLSGVFGLKGRLVPNTHSVFFQAPIGIVIGNNDTEHKTLQTLNALLNCTGFFIAYSEEPSRPAILDGRVTERYRRRLFQYIQPRRPLAANHVYQFTVKDHGFLPAPDDKFDGTSWFQSEVSNRTNCHVLAENVVALVIRPMASHNPTSYRWNSRLGDPENDLENLPPSFGKMPRSLKIVMAVIDEASAARLGNSLVDPLEDLLDELFRFESTAQFDADIKTLDIRLSERNLNYRVFTAEILLNTSNTNL